MKKIILVFIIITVIVVAILGVAFVFYNGSKKTYYPDSEGWDRKALQGDEFETLFPLTLGENLYLVSPTEEGVFESKGPSTQDTAFVEYRNNTKINLGTAEKENVFTIVTAQRSFYVHRTFKEMPALKIWTEQVSLEEFLKYKTALVDLLNSYPSTNIEKTDYKNHEYYTYLGKNLTPEGLKGKNSIGGVYVFFPEKNTGLFIFLFNTRYDTSNAYLISSNEINSITHEIIDSVIR